MVRVSATLQYQPHHSGHAGLEHRRRFDDDGANWWSTGVAKGQQEARHASGEALPFLVGGNVWPPLQRRDGSSRRRASHYRCSEGEVLTAAISSDLARTSTWLQAFRSAERLASRF